ncbi:MAG: sigma-70 family RNA polymerase sigma factor, partial [Opitutaceae bacterium]
MIEDAELLRRYADEKSEDDFAELVRRRIGLVYAVAWRHTRDTQRAEDVTQRVFTDLARKAEALKGRPVLVGWLYRSAQFAASDAVRSERRRQARAEEAIIMQQIAQEASEPDWDKLRPVLDEVLNDMDERDRDAVLLRFFDGRPFAEIGVQLRLTENAARMRVERALEKMRVALARRGVTSTTAALAVAFGNQVGVAAPAGLAASVTGAALSASAGVGATTTFLTLISMHKVSVIALAAITGMVALD